MSLPLESLRRCFEGVLPSAIATCSKDGIPNVTYLSQVHYLDERHVALSRQFFNKTTRNIDENPYARVHLVDPITLERYALTLRFLRSETQGPLFESMSSRIDAIAAHTGMTGVFRLIAADVFEVLALEHRAGYLDPSAPRPAPAELAPATGQRPLGDRFEVWPLSRMSVRVNGARSLKELFDAVLHTMGEDLGLEHVRVLLVDSLSENLVVRASRGFGEAAIGSRVSLRDGFIGRAVRERRPQRSSALTAELRYGRAIRASAEEQGLLVQPELPLPGLPDAQSHLALPLVVRDRVLGVLLLESRTSLVFDAWHEAFLEIVANQVAIGLERMLEDEEERAVEVPAAPPVEPPPPPSPVRRFVFYKNDDCVFLDGEYLIRNVPARILWKVLTSAEREGRTQFSNRELRLDPKLGLPELKDNLETRLLLLRRRLEQRCPQVRLSPCGRGRFALERDTRIELDERETA